MALSMKGHKRGSGSGAEAIGSSAELELSKGIERLRC